MLEASPGNDSRLAWLHDSKELKAIRIQGPSASAKVGSISFFAPDFAMSSATPWWVGEPLDLQPRAPHEALVRRPHLRHRADPSATHFAQLFEDIQARMGRSEFEKVVPMITQQLEFDQPLRLAMLPPYRELKYDQRFSYGFEFDGQGLCGVTPELLFSVDNGVLKTMALAGTGPADGSSLLQDPKEVFEHQLVIDYLLNALAPWGQVHCGPTHEKIFGALKHLRTEVEVKLSRPADFVELVKCLHPTAALGGWPRAAAWNWLQAQDFHTERRRFGAPFGYVDASGARMLCVVAIRGIQWENNCAWIHAGCGIVKQSQALREWQELQLKLKSIHQLLGMEDL